VPSTGPVRPGRPISDHGRAETGLAFPPGRGCPHGAQDQLLEALQEELKQFTVVKQSLSGSGKSEEVETWTVAAIVPAYNEEKTIGAVLEVLTKCRLINEVIVVSDGSTDDTVKIALQFDGVQVVELPENRGRGAL